MDFWEIFRSVEIVWLLWFSSMAVFGFLLRRLLIRLSHTDVRALWQRLSLRRFHRNQIGAAYSLSFILILPFLIFLIALIIETSYMLVAKIGTMHAAFAAARTGTVWSTGDTNDDAENGFSKPAKINAEQSAITAMVPYASGTPKVSGRENSDVSDKAEKYYRVYSDIKAHNPTPPPKGWGKELGKSYIKKKYRYSAYATQAELSLVPNENNNAVRWKQYVQAKVTYEYPFTVLPVGRALLGKEKGGRVVYEIQSIAKINNECPRNEQGKLGIRILP